MGTFPLSSTLSLRLFNLLHGSGYAPFAVDAVKSILRLPQISFGSEIGKEQLLHHLRFSIDFLRHAHLLDHDGQPINLFGVASHLYYQEPSNLALVALLQSGVIHDLCGQSGFKKAQDDFMLLACHLFGRRYLPDSYTTKKGIRDLVRKGPSVVVLPPLGGRARKVLGQKQKQILTIFTAYAVTFAAQHSARLEEDTRLSLSGQNITGMKTKDNDTPFHSHLTETAIRTQARSPFVANSGHTDTFKSISELTSTVRRGIHLNEHAIPSYEKIIFSANRSRESKHPLNAYLYDFWKHGQVAALANMNGIRRGGEYSTFLPASGAMFGIDIFDVMDRCLVPSSRLFPNSHDHPWRYRKLAHRVLQIGDSPRETTTFSVHWPRSGLRRFIRSRQWIPHPGSNGDGGRRGFGR